MDSVEYHVEVRRLVQERFKVLNRLLFCEIQSKLLLQLFMNITMLDIGDVGVHHKRDQVEDEVGTLAKDAKGGEAVVLESQVMG